MRSTKPPEIVRSRTAQSLRRAMLWATSIGTIACVVALLVTRRENAHDVAVGILVVMGVLLLGTVAATWFAYDRQLHKLAVWMRRLRTENVPEQPPGVASLLLANESNRLAASLRAARASGLAESYLVARADQVWTKDRLRARALSCLRHAQLIVVSNREPYLHEVVGGEARVTVPPGGLVAALDPVLQACGGLWIAHGAGSADRRTADIFGHLTVPPASPRYTLRRVWISPREERGYYDGFANEGLWPLCHLAHERPVFRAPDWAHYVAVNRRFADIVLDEIGAGSAMVLVQDYHLALAPLFIKERRPDVRVGIFWHIPWPSPDTFRICPWRAELINGVLGADVVGFQLQQYGNNFLDAVDRMVEAKLDRDHFTVVSREHTSRVRAFPISIDSDAEPGPLTGPLAGTLARYRESGVQIGIGVDRVDYTKGLPERFRAVRQFFEANPEYRERFTFVQIAAPSRERIRRYRDLLAELEELAAAINRDLRTTRWQPIHFEVGQVEGPAVRAYLAMGSVCIVSSLHDGMNLVAKEYVAAQAGDAGVLILSEFAGAARELTDALIVNPYDIDAFAGAIRTAVAMEPHERRARMSRMYQTLEHNNVYRWAANLLTELASTEPGSVARSGSPGRLELVRA